MVKKWSRHIVLLSCLLFVVLMAGCGGGGGDAPSATVGGVAATGAPLVGTVYLKDSSVPNHELSTPIAADGSFTFNVSNLKAPFILKAVGTAGGQSYTLYSFAADKGITNINPLTTFALVHAYGTDNLSSLYSSPDLSKMLSIQQQIAISVTQVRALLQSLLEQYGVGRINFLTDAFVANHQGLDLLFDMIVITFGDGTVSVKNKSTNSVIYTASSSDVLSGFVTIANIPSPPVQIPVSVIITQSSLTVANQGIVYFSASVSGTSNQKVLWSVVESNGGSITPAGIYTAPSIAGSYHVKATSAADVTKYSTATVTVAATPVTQKVWKTESKVSPSVTVSVGPSLGVSNYLDYHSGSIQCSLLSNGIANVNTINANSAYIVVFSDTSMLIGASNGNYWILIGTDPVTANATRVNASVQIYNGYTQIYSDYADLILQ